MEMSEPVPVPDDVLNVLTTLHWEMSNRIYAAKDTPQIRACALVYFKRTYAGEKVHDIKLLFKIISVFHLAAKVLDIIIKLKKIISVVKEMGDEFSRQIPSIVAFSAMDEGKVVQDMNRTEHDLIYQLDFRFDVQLPYNTVEYFTRRIIKWHMSPSDPDFHPIIEKLRDVAWCFLNDLIGNTFSVKYPPDILSIVAVILAFEIHGRHSCVAQLREHCSILLPYRNTKEILDAYSSIYAFFDEQGCFKQQSIRRWKYENTLEKWYSFPLEDVKPIEELCPPPPDDLMREIAGEPDVFTNSWWEHAPSVPPPPLSILAPYAAPSGTYKNTRPVSTTPESTVTEFGALVKDIEASAKASRRRYEDDNKRSPYNDKRFDDRNSHPRDNDYRRPPSRSSRDDYRYDRREDDRRRIDDERRREEDRRRIDDERRRDDDRRRIDDDRRRIDDERRRDDDRRRIDDERRRMEDDRRYDRRLPRYDDRRYRDDDYPERRRFEDRREGDMPRSRSYDYRERYHDDRRYCDDYRRK